MYVYVYQHFASYISQPIFLTKAKYFFLKMHFQNKITQEIILKKITFFFFFKLFGANKTATIQLNINTLASGPASQSRALQPHRHWLTASAAL